LRPWRYRNWLSPRDPQFALKAGRILDLSFVSKSTTSTRQNPSSRCSRAAISPRCSPRPVVDPPGGGENTSP
jgi:hypothetical protein